MNKADVAIQQLRAIGNRLMPYTFPKNDPMIEADITPLKMMETTVDGYQITLHYNKADYGDHYIETFQIIGKYFPFLPFNLVLKLAVKMLGSDELYLAEVYQDNRKIYCWTKLTDKKGRPMEYPAEEDRSHHCSYDGVQYIYMDPSHLNFY